MKKIEPEWYLVGAGIGLCLVAGIVQFRLLSIAHESEKERTQAYRNALEDHYARLRTMIPSVDMDDDADAYETPVPRQD